MSKSTQPIDLTGRVFLTGALADIYPSHELGRHVEAGDVKLWCHRARERGAAFGSGQFRAAVHDGKEWRTFRLNFVADEDARYGSLDERRRKLRRCLDDLAGLKDETAVFRASSYGVTVSLRRQSTPPRTVQRKPAGESQPRTASAPTAQRTATTQPATGSTNRGATGSRRGRRRKDDPNQLRLF